MESYRGPYIANSSDYGYGSHFVIFMCLLLMLRIYLRVAYTHVHMLWDVLKYHSEYSAKPLSKLVRFIID